MSVEKSDLSLSLRKTIDATSAKLYHTLNGLTKMQGEKKRRMDIILKMPEDPSN